MIIKMTDHRDKHRKYSSSQVDQNCRFYSNVIVEQEVEVGITLAVLTASGN